MKIQLLFFEGCPNVASARASLRRCLQLEGLVPEFDEIDLRASGTLQELRGWGSPTILVDGEDVAGTVPSGAESCRLYGENKGVPSDAVIRNSLRPRGSDD